MTAGAVNDTGGPVPLSRSGGRPAVAVAAAADPWPDATRAGTISAVAGQSQRHMQEWLAEYPGLFSAEPFDAALSSTLSLAMAFSGPWFGAAQLRMANKACLWAFGLDWLVDYVATSAREVDDIARRCLAVADGADPVPGDDLTRFLSDMREELTAAPAFATLGPVWRAELARMLEGMRREREWRDSDVTPSFEEYLENADNLGFSFAFTSHLIHTGGLASTWDLPRVWEASRAVQRVVRLLNDLGTYERDVKWGDLNALMLGVTREEVDRHIAGLARHSRELIAPLRAAHPHVAGYLERQMDFCAGFYRLADYWGSL
ncbi:terpene synthase family protein [Sphaerisporangium perillae]|uniref:terpene synthase family protein n=1 Tax=Sphaerisporangium perillae TaxID=2935860 RepID=UPI00200C0AAF|nr:terpene synthase family protein [Sphaerisporangium perillae]